MVEVLNETIIPNYIYLYIFMCLDLTSNKRKLTTYK